MKMLRNTFGVLALLILSSCASVESDPSIGVWNVSMDSPVGAIEALLTIVGDGTGTLVSDMLGEAETTDVLSDGNALSFSLTINAQGQTVPLSFAGEVNGDEISGSFDSSFGPVPMTGTRQ